jgi:hypothetical protein
MPRPIKPGAQPEQDKAEPGAKRFELPWDLSVWADRPILLQWIVEEVGSLDWENQELLKVLQANPAFQPRAMLILTTYAYALGLCESEDVVSLCYTEPALKSFMALVPFSIPSENAVSRFRREHRGLIKWALVQCFKRGLRHHELGDSPIPPGLRRILDESAANRLDLARHLDRSVQAE